MSAPSPWGHSGTLQRSLGAGHSVLDSLATRARPLHHQPPTPTLAHQLLGKTQSLRPCLPSPSLMTSWVQVEAKLDRDLSPASCPLISLLQPQVPTLQTDTCHTDRLLVGLGGIRLDSTLRVFASFWGKVWLFGESGVAVSLNCEAPGGSSLSRTVFKGALQSTSWPEKRMVFRPGAFKSPANDLLTTKSHLSDPPKDFACCVVQPPPPASMSHWGVKRMQPVTSCPRLFPSSQPFLESTAQQAALSSGTHLLLYPEGYAAVPQAKAPGLESGRSGAC